MYLKPELMRLIEICVSVPELKYLKPVSALTRVLYLGMHCLLSSATGSQQFCRVLIPFVEDVKSA